MNAFRLRCAAVVAALALFALAVPLAETPARAQNAASARKSPTPLTPLAPLAECHVGVLAILSLATPSNGKDYAAFLWSPDGAGAASGSIWIATSAGSYRAIFKNHAVLGPTFDGDVEPVTFRLPKDAELRSAFVDLLEDPDPGPCTVYQSWAPGITAHLRSDLAARFAAMPEPPATVPALVIDRARDCHSGGAPARTLLEAVPPGTVNATGDVEVTVHLAPDSSVTGATIKHSTNPALDSVALTAARGSVFATEIKNCDPVATDVVYTVHFAVKQTPLPVASPAR
jgi:hypothetical protein